MAELANIGETLKKIPPLGWAAIVGGIGIVLWMQSQQSASAPAAAPSTVDTTGSTNTSTPTGVCGSPDIPVCPVGEQLVWETDQNGCPLPTCSGSLTSSPVSPPAAVCHSTLHGGHYVVGQSGPLTTLRQVFSSVGQDPNCAVQWNPTAINRGLDEALWPGFVVYY